MRTKISDAINSDFFCEKKLQKRCQGDKSNVTNKNYDKELKTKLPQMLKSKKKINLD